MDMSKCHVVVIAPEDSAAPAQMTPQMMHALVRARETHIRYRSYVGTAFVQLTVTGLLAMGSSSPKSLVLSLLGASLVNAALYGLIARAWRRQFEQLSSK